jgi:hypothetical protein
MRRGKRRSTTRQAPVVSLAEARERRRRLAEGGANAIVDAAFRAGIAPDPVDSEPPAAHS